MFQQWDKLNLVYTISDIETFWSVFNNMQRPSQIVSNNYAVFRHDIDMKWEAPENRNGGRWLFTIEPQWTVLGKDGTKRFLMDTVWESLLILALSGKYDTAVEQLYGLVTTCRPSGCRIHIWTGSSDPKVLEAQQKWISSFCQLPKDCIVQFKKHTDNTDVKTC